MKNYINYEAKLMKLNDLTAQNKMNSRNKKNSMDKRPSADDVLSKNDRSYNGGKEYDTRRTSSVCSSINENKENDKGVTAKVLTKKPTTTTSKTFDAEGQVGEASASFPVRGVNGESECHDATSAAAAQRGSIDTSACDIGAAAETCSIDGRLSSCSSRKSSVTKGKRKNAPYLTLLSRTNSIESLLR